MALKCFVYAIISAARFVSALALGGLHAWFFLKFLLVDPWPALQRNAAYFRTHQYMVVAVLIGCLVMEFWERTTGLALSTGQMGNFLTLLFFTGLIMPASILAWQDRPSAGFEDEDPGRA